LAKWKLRRSKSSTTSSSVAGGLTCEWLTRVWSVQYALSFDMGCVDGIRGVLQAMRHVPKEELNAWRQSTQSPADLSLEVHLLLGDILSHILR